MRDILVTLIAFGSLPYIFKKPYWGAVMWIWISVMNLHSQGWGFARTFPFAAVIGGASILSFIMYRGDKKLPKTALIGTFIAFMVWMSLTTMFAIHGADLAYGQWVKVMKIFGMTLLVTMLMKEREHIIAVIWTIVISLGYYGVKGGIFTIRSGGSERVWGPEGTFIDGNNEIALALIIVIPLMYYLHSLTKNRWGRYAFMGSMFLCALASLGSYSRGAALALAAMTVMMWLKSKNKVKLGVVMVFVIPVLLTLMPQQWFNRVDTIKTYEEDSSAMGRINAWKMATNLALDRPMGGGFEIYDGQVFALYAPNPADVHAAHSIYFQVLGEHGFVGLLLYLLIGIMTWRTGSWIVKRASKDPELRWTADLAVMIQVSLLGFAVGGAFLSLVYFDVPYYLMAAMAGMRVIIERTFAQRIAAERNAQREQADLAAGLGAPNGSNGGNGGTGSSTGSDTAEGHHVPA